jgi:hypothetical protein
VGIVASKAIAAASSVGISSSDGGQRGIVQLLHGVAIDCNDRNAVLAGEFLEDSEAGWSIVCGECERDRSED